MNRVPRTIPCHYEDTAGEHTIAVTVRRDGRGHRDWTIETDLSDVPADELASVRQQAIDGWMAADEREHGAPEPPAKRSTSGTKWSDDDYEAAGYGRITLRLPQADLDKLDAIAKSSKRPRSAVVAAWIREWGT